MNEIEQREIIKELVAWVEYLECKKCKKMNSANLCLGNCPFEKLLKKAKNQITEGESNVE